jgi:hypothetical protein
MRGGRGGMHGGSPGFGQDRPKRQRCRDYDGKCSCTIIGGLSTCCVVLMIQFR